MWNSLSPQYKNALLQDHQWLEDTINQYVKDRKERTIQNYLSFIYISCLKVYFEFIEISK